MFFVFKNTFEEFLKNMSSETSNILFFKNIGISQEEFRTIENVLDNDPIQTRLPYLITLE